MLNHHPSVKILRENSQKLELTLDNFEQIYEAYLKAIKYSRKIVGYSPYEFINEVKRGDILYRNEKLFTRLKDLRYTTEIEQKLDEIVQRVFGA